MDDVRQRARELQRDYVSRGDPTGWFEPFYAAAGHDPAHIHWADLAPNAQLVAWLDREQPSGDGRTALVVGCGLGDDAELLSGRGYRVTAFDIAPTAIAWCRERFPNATVDYVTASVLDLPPAWRAAFDLVVEIYTLQVLPAELRASAVAQLAATLRPGGRLVAIARARDADDAASATQWALTREELAEFGRLGLVETRFEDYLDAETPPTRRFRATYHRPA